MRFDAEQAVWIGPAGVCQDYTLHCPGMYGIDHDNNQMIVCSRNGCPAQLPEAAVAAVVEQLDV
jgi:hypothetical protein